MSCDVLEQVVFKVFVLTFDKTFLCVLEPLPFRMGLLATLVVGQSFFVKVSVFLGGLTSITNPSLFF